MNKMYHLSIDYKGAVVSEFDIIKTTDLKYTIAGTNGSQFIKKESINNLRRHSDNLCSVWCISDIPANIEMGRKWVSEQIAMKIADLTRHQDIVNKKHTERVFYQVDEFGDMTKANFHETFGE